METLDILLFVLIGGFSILHLVQAQDQQGFINLDCGLPSNESYYVERSTGLIYSSDEGFVKSGKSSRIQKDWEKGSIKPYRVLRYFPDGIRNCYDLTVTQGTTYLIRAVFWYGNYDGLNKFPKFDLYIGPNLWTTVDLGPIEITAILGFDGTFEEMIHIPSSNSLEICLVKTGTTTPLISALELRPLRNDPYFTKTGPLKLLSRYHFSSSDSLFGDSVRYPDDVHDRMWHSYSGIFEDLKLINATFSVNSHNSFEVPQSVIATAATQTDANSNNPMGVYFPQRSDDRAYVYLHFAEIQALGPNETREFNIVWNGENITNSAFRPWMLQINTIFSSSPTDCRVDICYLDLVKTNRSTLPPILNAVEAFAVMALPLSGTNPDDVVAMKNIQALYGLNKISWQGDPCVPQQFKWEGLDCSYTTVPPRITSLSLSSSGLRGIIAPSIQNLTQLQKLDLSNNNLTGEVPAFLANLKSLSIINLSLNNLSGSIPQALRDRQNKGLKLIVEGNPGLCLSYSCKNPAGKSRNNGKKILVAAVGTAASIAIVVAVLVLIFVVKKKRPLRALRQSILTKKKRFTYSEVVTMTNNFQRVLGQGGFGVVFHGNLSGDEQVAVKVLSQSSIQGYKQFNAEVELLFRVHHINLVSLVGYCDEGDHLALVYEYMANGDLKQYISGKRDGFAFNWASRLKIAVETASGLEYLHTGCKPPMVHRDVKTTNILLDEHFQAKIADFGLSRSFPIGGESHVSTNAVGTPGYLDPEYYRTNWLTEKSDVYSFGIVLLEIITCQLVIAQDRERTHIAEWVELMLTKGDIGTIVDPSLHGDYDSGSIWRALELAMSCVNPSFAGRPTMSQVVTELRELLTSEISSTEGSRVMDSKSSLEQRMSLGTEVTSDAR